MPVVRSAVVHGALLSPEGLRDARHSWTCVDRSNGIISIALLLAKPRKARRVGTGKHPSGQTAVVGGRGSIHQPEERAAATNLAVSDEKWTLILAAVAMEALESEEEEIAVSRAFEILEKGPSGSPAQAHRVNSDMRSSTPLELRRNCRCGGTVLAAERFPLRSRGSCDPSLPLSVQAGTSGALFASPTVFLFQSTRREVEAFVLSPPETPEDCCNWTRHAHACSPLDDVTLLGGALRDVGVEDAAKALGHGTRGCEAHLEGVHPAENRRASHDPESGAHLLLFAPLAPSRSRQRQELEIVQQDCMHMTVEDLVEFQASKFGADAGKVAHFVDGAATFLVAHDNWHRQRVSMVDVTVVACRPSSTNEGYYLANSFTFVTAVLEGAIEVVHDTSLCSGSPQRQPRVSCRWRVKELFVQRGCQFVAPSQAGRPRVALRPHHYLWCLLADASLSAHSIVAVPSVTVLKRRRRRTASVTPSATLERDSFVALRNAVVCGGFDPELGSFCLGLHPGRHLANSGMGPCHSNPPSSRYQPGARSVRGSLDDVDDDEDDKYLLEQHLVGLAGPSSSDESERDSSAPLRPYSSATASQRGQCSRSTVSDGAVYVFPLQRTEPLPRCPPSHSWNAPGDASGESDTGSIEFAGELWESPDLCILQLLTHFLEATAPATTAGGGTSLSSGSVDQPGLWRTSARLRLWSGDEVARDEESTASAPSSVAPGTKPLATQKYFKDCVGVVRIDCGMWRDNSSRDSAWRSLEANILSICAPYQPPTLGSIPAVGFTEFVVLPALCSRTARAAFGFPVEAYYWRHVAAQQRRRQRRRSKAPAEREPGSRLKESVGDTDGGAADAGDPSSRLSGTQAEEFSLLRDPCSGERQHPSTVGHLQKTTDPAAEGRSLRQSDDEGEDGSPMMLFGSSRTRSFSTFSTASSFSANISTSSPSAGSSATMKPPATSLAVGASSDLSVALIAVHPAVNETRLLFVHCDEVDLSPGEDVAALSIPRCDVVPTVCFPSDSPSGMARNIQRWQAWAKEAAAFDLREGDGAESLQQRALHLLSLIWQETALEGDAEFVHVAEHLASGAGRKSAGSFDRESNVVAPSPSAINRLADALFTAAQHLACELFAFGAARTADCVLQLVLGASPYPTQASGAASLVGGRTPATVGLRSSTRYWAANRSEEVALSCSAEVKYLQQILRHGFSKAPNATCLPLVYAWICRNPTAPCVKNIQLSHVFSTSKSPLGSGSMGVDATRSHNTSGIKFLTLRLDAACTATRLLAAVHTLRSGQPAELLHRWSCWQHDGHYRPPAPVRLVQLIIDVALHDVLSVGGHVTAEAEMLRVADLFVKWGGDLRKVLKREVAARVDCVLCERVTGLGRGLVPLTAAVGFLGAINFTTLRTFPFSRMGGLRTVYLLQYFSYVGESLAEGAVQRARDRWEVSSARMHGTGVEAVAAAQEDVAVTEACDQESFARWLSNAEANANHRAQRAGCERITLEEALARHNEFARLQRSIAVLRLLCGEDEQQAQVVIGHLVRHRVPLAALSVFYGQAPSDPAKGDAAGSIPDGVSASLRRQAVQALSAIFATTGVNVIASLLTYAGKDASCDEDRIGEPSSATCGDGQRIALAENHECPLRLCSEARAQSVTGAMWTSVLCDATDALEKLQLLHNFTDAVVRPCEGASPAASASRHGLKHKLLVALLRPLFSTALPRFVETQLATAALSAHGNSHDSGSGRSSEVDDEFSRCDLTSLRSVLDAVGKLLVRLQGSCTELRCLRRLFDVSRRALPPQTRPLSASCAEVSDPSTPSTASSADDGEDRDVSHRSSAAGLRSRHFALSYSTMLLVAFYGTSVDQSRFVVTVSQIRREVSAFSLRILRSYQSRSAFELQAHGEGRVRVSPSSIAVHFVPRDFINLSTDYLALCSEALHEMSPLLARVLLYLFLEESVMHLTEMCGDTLPEMAQLTQQLVEQAVRTNAVDLPARSIRQLHGVLSPWLVDALPASKGLLDCVQQLVGEGIPLCSHPAGGKWRQETGPVPAVVQVLLQSYMAGAPDNASLAAMGAGITVSGERHRHSESGRYTGSSVLLDFVNAAVSGSRQNSQSLRIFEQRPYPGAAVALRCSTAPSLGNTDMCNAVTALFTPAGDAPRRKPTAGPDLTSIPEDGCLQRWNDAEPTASVQLVTASTGTAVQAVQKQAVTLLVKEEQFERSRMELRCLHDYSTAFLGPVVLQSWFPVVLGALRIEKRRRTLVQFAVEQRDIIETYVHLFLDLLRVWERRERMQCAERCRAHIAAKVILLHRQERESRRAIDVMSQVALEVLSDDWHAALALLTEEEWARRDLEEAEDLRRDAVYEAFAVEEMHHQQREQELHDSERLESFAAADSASVESRQGPWGHDGCVSSTEGWHEEDVKEGARSGGVKSPPASPEPARDLKQEVDVAKPIRDLFDLDGGAGRSSGRVEAVKSNEPDGVALLASDIKNVWSRWQASFVAVVAQPRAPQFPPTDSARADGHDDLGQPGQQETISVALPPTARNAEHVYQRRDCEMIAPQETVRADSTTDQGAAARGGGMRMQGEPMKARARPRRGFLCAVRQNELSPPHSPHEPPQDGILDWPEAVPESARKSLEHKGGDEAESDGLLATPLPVQTPPALSVAIAPKRKKKGRLGVVEMAPLPADTGAGDVPVLSESGRSEPLLANPNLPESPQHQQLINLLEKQEATERLATNEEERAERHALTYDEATSRRVAEHRRQMRWMFSSMLLEQHAISWEAGMSKLACTAAVVSENLRQEAALAVAAACATHQVSPHGPDRSPEHRIETETALGSTESGDLLLSSSNPSTVSVPAAPKRKKKGRLGVVELVASPKLP